MHNLRVKRKKGWTYESWHPQPKQRRNSRVESKGGKCLLLRSRLKERLGMETVRKAVERGG